MGSKQVHLEFDPGLWREFKAACAHYDISMKATLIKHIQNIVNDYRIYQMEYAGRNKKQKKGGRK